MPPLHGGRSTAAGWHEATRKLVGDALQLGRWAWSLPRIPFCHWRGCLHVQRLQPIELLHRHHQDDGTPMFGDRHGLGAGEVDQPGSVNVW